ncbi:hypothetical protein BJY04DRAFT_221737 [Aspergillus karnatakaensis]|uniref:uncharacterized protein n=1 Tax=Aspergillus karnatakaensis TaxID=1810916 RepID=UPI003CCCA958
MPYHALAVHLESLDPSYSSPGFTSTTNWSHHEDPSILRILITAKDEATFDTCYDVVRENTKHIWRDEDCEDWIIYSRREFDIELSTSWCGDEFIGRVVFSHQPDFPMEERRRRDLYARREGLGEEKEEGDRGAGFVLGTRG